jgi:hypothetical protein
MGLAAGINAAIAFRILGAAPNVPLQEMRSFLPVMWFGFWLNFVSGIVLLIGYPTKALTNPDFYLNLALIAGGVWLVGVIRDRLESVPKGLAIASLICWGGARTQPSGRRNRVNERPRPVARLLRRLMAAAHLHVRHTRRSEGDSHGGRAFVLM